MPVDSLLPASETDVLAGKSSADDIDTAFGSSRFTTPADPLASAASGVGHKPALVNGDLADVSENRDAWPTGGKDGAAVGVDFTERDGSHSGSFESKAESPNAAKEIEHIHGLALSSRAVRSKSE